MRRKRGLCLLLAASMALGSSFTALAADKKIDTVKLSFSYSKAPESGDEIGDITVKAGSSGFEVDSAEYTNIEDQDTWTVGDIPEVKVELSAKDGYKFSYTSKSHFSLSGCNADFKKAKIYDDGQYIEVYAELKRIGGKLQGASELEWNDTTAEWEEIEGAKSYDVKLLRDDKTVTTVSTTGTSYNFAGYFNREGDYTFRVRAISRYNNKTGEWSEDSNSLYIDEDELGRYGGSGHWEQDGTGVWYAYDTGGYPASCWKQINGAWYYFNNKGYIVTGWQKLDGTWYYLNPSNGIMMTGWQAINGKWYYMNGSGEMQTGWQAINGRWYYLDGSGAMQTGWQRLGGQWYYLDPSGAMQTGWQDIGGARYYLNDSGVMLTDWQDIGGARYYFNSSGAMVSGWQDIGGARYYFDTANGALAVNTVLELDGVKYQAGADGVCTPITAETADAAQQTEQAQQTPSQQGPGH